MLSRVLLIGIHPDAVDISDPALPPGLTPSEVGFLCEMELVTVIPRQRLDGLELLGVSVP